ncbi:prostaglandin E2 receptor EP4 subtype-like [Mercenaria mercenaria]|uniref:prostaglandin E2 receptor EP4 subtype-like n=1 Tax=Mercenaria mercenaria TaxID=6596 RepID=UPI00234E4661|nr:prostaglandin E2 receptor EP4 subtype-like [Mercenaria mercenaria]XP_045160321.2 prostaglandin E2 receptor EP4 subtype-like [Mercenaria mercenaria]
MCNITSNVTNFTDCSTSPAGATILSPVFMSVAGVLGNILALYSLYKARTDIRTTKFYSLIIGLAWTDLLGILMTSPSVIIAYVNRRQWVGGDAHCRFHGFTMATFGLATPLIICAMAVERFLALKCVFFYSSRCHTGTSRGCILIIWFGVILYSLLPLFGFGSFEKQYPGTWCYLDFHSENIASKVYGYIYACTNLILILMIGLCNTYVVITIFKTRFRRDSESVYSLGHPLPEHDGLVTTRNQRKKSNDAEIQMIMLLCALTVVFTVCWAPLMLRIIMTQATGIKNVLLDLAAVRLASLNQTLDPWLYILLRRSTCMKISRSVKQIKTKCLKVVREQVQDSELIKEKDAQSIDQNSENGRACDRIHNVQDDVHKHNNENSNNIPPPDVMKIGSRGYISPLPDITNTLQNKENKDSRYVCHFQFGKSLSPKEEDGMYVKILYLKNNSSNTNTYNERTPERQCLCYQSKGKLTDNLPLPVVTQHNISVTHTECGNSHTKTSGTGTKETSLSSRDLNATFHSENTNCPSYTRYAHESLRKTKSNNE